MGYRDGAKTIRPAPIQGETGAVKGGVNERAETGN
jgi:hypothetical protein